MIRLHRQDPVATIVIDRPERGNSLDRRTVELLHEALDEIGSGASIVVLRGAGSRSFCGGVDAQEMVSLSARERQEAMRRFTDCALSLWEHPALTVGALQGNTAGGGAHVALACDVRTASPSTSMRFLAPRYGLSLSATWLSLYAGPATAAMLLASGRAVDANECLRLGLIQAIASPGDALSSLQFDATVDPVALKGAIRAAAPTHVRAAILAEHADAVERAAADGFVTKLAQEAAARTRPV